MAFIICKRLFRFRCVHDDADDDDAYLEKAGQCKSNETACARVVPLFVVVAEPKEVHTSAYKVCKIKRGGAMREGARVGAPDGPRKCVRGHEK